MNYYQQLNKVIEFIGKNIDEELSLEKLSEIACISQFHFHRLFTAFTGLSLQQYIKWLRLKRAARQLIFDKDQSIINIAINAGFESHEAFSRAFKKACGLSPNQYRYAADFGLWEKPPYCLPERGATEMKVEIKNSHKIRLAVIEHRGDPKLLPDSINKLMTWAKTKIPHFKLKAGEAFAFAYNDPKTTPADEFCFDLGIKVSENLKLDGDVVEKFIPAGRYAVAVHKGSRDKIGETVYPLYREWLPNSGEQLGDLPCIFCYYNFEHEVAETESLTEIWLLLK